MRSVVPRSVRSRAAAAAALAGLLLFASGALWMRHVVRAERMRSVRATAADVVETSMAIGSLGLRSPETDSDPLLCNVGSVGLVLSDSPFSAGDEFAALELVGPDGVVLYSSQSLKSLERGRAILPAPATAAPPPVFGPVEVDVSWVTLGPGNAPLANGTYEVLSTDVPFFDLDRYPNVQCEWDPKAQATAARLHVLVLPFDADRAVAAIDRTLLPGVPAGALLLALVAWLATDRALRPVERMRAMAATIGTTDLDRRLPVPRSGDHLTRLAETLNSMLDRLAYSARRQRRFVADAAHELRSPIASLRVIVDTATDPERALTDATFEVRRLQRLTEDLLLLSTIDTDVPPRREDVDLAALAAEHLADRGRVGHVRFHLAARPPAPVRGNRAQIDRLLTNLLDNAERHARSHVTVVVTAEHQGVRIEVVDDGSGVPTEHRDRVFERFTRLDDARDRDHGGVGLGLAIARDICLRHGGSLTVTDAGTGGACFVAVFPRAV